MNDEEPLPLPRANALRDAAAGWTCKYCGHVGIRIEWRLTAKPLGTFSLAGYNMKVSSYLWPYAVCDGCGHESRGKVE